MEKKISCATPPLTHITSRNDGHSGRHCFSSKKSISRPAFRHLLSGRLPAKLPACSLSSFLSFASPSPLAPRGFSSFYQSPQLHVCCASDAERAFQKAMPIRRDFFCFRIVAEVLHCHCKAFLDLSSFHHLLKHALNNPFERLQKRG